MKKKSLKPLFKHPALLVAPCEFGHGVFVSDPIPAHTTLEECHHLRITDNECGGILDDYVFGLEPDTNETETESVYYSLPLGWGCIYNHAEEHNTDYWHDADRDLIIFYTIKDVAAGDQLFVNYGREWWETREMTPVDGK